LRIGKIRFIAKVFYSHANLAFESPMPFSLHKEQNIIANSNESNKERIEVASIIMPKLIKETMLPAKAINCIVVTQITDNGVTVKSKSSCYLCSTDHRPKYEA
jgi:hypothetical protein